METVIVARPLWPVLGRISALLPSAGYLVEAAPGWERIADPPGGAGDVCGVLLGEYGELFAELDLLRKFRARGGPGIPAVVVGGRHALDRAARFRQAGANAVVPADMPAERLLDICLPLFRYGRLFREQDAMIRELREGSFRDGLTGLPNRRQFDLDVTRHVALARRTGRPLSCVLADIDDFRAVVERHGASAGDAAIVRFGQILQRTKRTYDTVARLEGNAFAWLLVNADRQAALLAATRSRAAVREADFGEGPAPLRLTATFGVSSIRPGVDVSAEDLVGNADRALYWGKESGKDVIRFYPREETESDAAADSRVS